MFVASVFPTIRDLVCDAGTPTLVVHADATKGTPQWFHEHCDANERGASKIAAIPVEYLLKGEHRKDRYNAGDWIQNSAHPGRRRLIATGWEYAWRQAETML